MFLEIQAMRKITLLLAATLMGAVLALGAGQANAEQMGFDRLIHGDDLYGLPNIVTPSNVAPRTWDRIDYGDDLYGLPNVVTVFQKKELLWDKLDYGDDLYGLPAIVTITTSSDGGM